MEMYHNSMLSKSSTVLYFILLPELPLGFHLSGQTSMPGKSSQHRPKPWAAVQRCSR